MATCPLRALFIQKVFVIHWVQTDQFSSVEAAFEEGKKRPRLASGSIKLQTHDFGPSLENSNMTKEAYEKALLDEPFDTGGSPMVFRYEGFFNTSMLLILVLQFLSSVFPITAAMILSAHSFQWPLTAYVTDFNLLEELKSEKKKDVGRFLSATFAGQHRN